MIMFMEGDQEHVMLCGLKSRVNRDYEQWREKEDERRWTRCS
jgi:hypothetical protein